MSRIRADHLSGTLGASLGLGDTTLTATRLSDLPAVAAPDVAAITIYDGPNFEVVHVTAHTAAADTATIIRGQEGTAAQAWDAGASWVHGPTVQDFDEKVTATATITKLHGPITQAAYDALTPDADTLYIIEG